MLSDFGSMPRESVHREMDFSSSRLSAKKPGDSCPKPKFFKACGGSKINHVLRGKGLQQVFSGRFLASPKSGDVFISSPHPVIPRRVALQQSPLLFRGTAPLSQREPEPSRTIFAPAPAAPLGRPGAWLGAVGVPLRACGPVRQRFPARVRPACRPGRCNPGRYASAGCCNVRRIQ